MTKFSSRFGYDPRASGGPLVEEAPEWLRVAYINGILDQLTYIDQDPRYSNTDDRPLGIKGLSEAFHLVLRQESGPEFFDSWSCDDALTGLVKSVEWFNFYDFVELVARELREAESWHFEESWIKRFGAETYSQKVNSLFAEERVAWRLNSKSDLSREVPAAYAKAHAAAEALMKNEFEPSRDHYRKACRYIYERPLDPENGIKEIVSAVESVGKVIYPGTATLGDVVKQMRKDSRFPEMLISVVEKFYAFANSEPAVRHGATVNSRVVLDDGEFCLQTGVALIRYLRAKHTRAPNTPMNPTPLRGSLVDSLLGAGYRQAVMPTGIR